jgi:hypothetical protein
MEVRRNFLVPECEHVCELFARRELQCEACKMGRSENSIAAISMHGCDGLQAIVADVELSNTNMLTHNRTYSKIGASQTLSTDPAVLHFGGFQLGQVYKQTLLVRNISTVGTRHHILPPTTPFFKVQMLKC